MKNFLCCFAFSIYITVGCNPEQRQANSDNGIVENKILDNGLPSDLAGTYYDWALPGKRNPNLKPERTSFHFNLLENGTWSYEIDVELYKEQIHRENQKRQYGAIEEDPYKAFGISSPVLAEGEYSVRKGIPGKDYSRDFPPTDSAIYIIHLENLKGPFSDKIPKKLGVFVISDPEFRGVKILRIMESIADHDGETFRMFNNLEIVYPENN